VYGDSRGARWRCDGSEREPVRGAAHVNYGKQRDALEAAGGRIVSWPGACSGPESVVGYPQWGRRQV